MALLLLKKMMAQSNKAIRPNDPVPKKRGLLSFLFVPNFSPGITPIRETNSIFVNVLALLFVMNGLFPKNHPAFARDSKVKLGFWEVMRTARSNLVFTKEKMPQALFFIAVVGCIVIVTLTAFVAFLSLFIGHAHADTASACTTSTSSLTSMFSACGGDSDIANMFINYLFNGTAVPDSLDPNKFTPIGSTNATVIQCGLYVALGYYSDALLVIAALILFYHLAWMTVETAHHGNVMGQRGNQIWAPIRLVFAIGLLVPVGNTASDSTNCAANTTGLNSGQLLVVHIATWGSGLASNIWAQFLEAVGDNTTNQLIPPKTGPVRKIVHDAIMMYACQWAINWYVDGRGAYGDPFNASALNQISGSKDIADMLTVYDPNYNGWYGDIAPAGWGNGLGYYSTAGGDGSVTVDSELLGTTPMKYFQSSDQSTSTTSFPTQHFTFTNGQNAGTPICGSYTIQGAPPYFDSNLPGAGSSSTSDASSMQTLINNIYTDQAIAFFTMMTDDSYGGANAFTAADEGIQYFIEDPRGPNWQVPPPIAAGTGNSNDVLTPLVTAYQANLKTLITNHVNAVGTDDTGATNYRDTLETDGWIAAGAWFNRVARIQTDLTVAATDGMPTTTPPNIKSAYAHIDPTTTPTNWTIIDSNAIYDEVGPELEQMDKWLNTMNNNVQASTDTSLQGQALLAAGNLGSSSNSNCVSGAAPFVHSMDCLALLIDTLGAMNGVWHSVPANTSNPENLLGVQFVGANPLAEIADYGNSLLATAYNILDWGVLGSFIEGGVSGALQSGLNIAYTPTFGAALTAVGGTLFTLGFLMAYFVPLIPFIQFFFGVIAWIVAMLEAVVMVPLIALAHLNPEGDGLPGDMARGGYFLLFQVFLRPVLMVFGLICGFLIFYLAVTFLNLLFSVAVAGTGGLSHGHFTMARLIYTAIYVLLVVVAANHSFELVSRLPNMSMQWLGAGGAQGLDIESVAGLESRVGLVGGYIGQQGAQQISGAASGVGRIGGTAVGMAGRAALGGATETQAATGGGPGHQGTPTTP